MIFEYSCFKFFQKVNNKQIIKPILKRKVAISEMDSNSRSISLLCVVFCQFLIINSLSSVATGSSSRDVSISSDGKVSLDFYYDTLCPFSSRFFVNYLKNLFDIQLISIVDLKLVPYGNAEIRSNDTIVCQHGPPECLLNTVAACAIDIWPEVREHFPFIYCVEKLVYEHKYPEWKTCFEKLGLDSKPISDCYSSGYGKKLELKYAAETDSLEPPHEYVPWVVVNGQPLYEDYENFISYVCEAYKGSSVPKTCSKISLLSSV